MTAVTAETVKTLLATIIDPHTGVDVVTGGSVRGVGVDGENVSLDVCLGYPALQWPAELAATMQSTLEADTAIAHASVGIRCNVQRHQVQEGLKPLAGVKNIIAIGSGKGGVGKSTVAANLALALQAEGAKVGILDGDIYGPSQPRMLGVSGKPESPDGKRIIPHRAHGLQMMSIGLLVEEDTPMIWRGPMATQALQQLLNESIWEDLDYLILDLPPGTGDIQLTLAQKIPVAGAIIVTTPQDISLLDARKALRMFEKVNIPVLGIVENMASHVCSNCGHEEDIFGSGGGQAMADQYHVPLLGQLPLDIEVRRQADSGTPMVAAKPESEITLRYREIARNAAGRLSQRPRNKAMSLPNLVVE
ncbi:MAG: iron-sulfur cluster carrier protein ApbC [Dokdonella sp.]